METNEFKINTKIMWILATANALVTIVGAVAKFQKYELTGGLVAAGLMFIVTVWILILSDMLKHKLYNKSFWIMSIFILPSITPIIYLLRRDKLILFADRFGNRNS